MTGAAFYALYCRLLGDDQFVDGYEATMGGEDFSFFSHAGIPSTYVFLGTRNDKIGAVHPLHSAEFKLDEDILPIGAAYHTALAMEFLTSKGKGVIKDEL